MSCPVTSCPHIEKDDGEVVLMGDELRLENVLTQFLIHAAKTAPSHSQIKVVLTMKVGKPIKVSATESVSSPTSLKPLRTSLLPNANNDGGRRSRAGSVDISRGAAFVAGGVGVVGGVVVGAPPPRRKTSVAVPGQAHLMTTTAGAAAGGAGGGGVHHHREVDDDAGSSDNLLDLVRGPLLPSAPASPPPGI